MLQEEPHPTGAPPMTTTLSRSSFRRTTEDPNRGSLRLSSDDAEERENGCPFSNGAIGRMKLEKTTSHHLGGEREERCEQRLIKLTSGWVWKFSTFKKFNNIFIIILALFRIPILFSQIDEKDHMEFKN